MGIPWHELLNLEKYTVLELILFGGGCYLWVFVYAIYVRQILKHQFIEMPVFAACGNIAWEFVWGFVYTTDMGPLLVWCYRIWFFIDLFIFWAVLRYGWKQFYNPAFRKHFAPTHVALALAWGLFFWLMVASHLDTPIGANSAFLLNLTISGLYVMLVVGGKKDLILSWPVAWLKMIGTGMNTVFMNIHPEYAENYFLRYLSILTTVVDCIYIYLLWRRRRAER